MEIPPPISISLQDSEGTESASHLPKGPGIYAFRARGAIVHIASSPHLKGRIVRLLSRNTGNSTLGARMRDAGIILDCWPTGSRLESSLMMYQLLRSECPADYRKRLRLALPWFVTMTTRDLFPRLAVANRIPSGQGPVFGPFKSRDSAQGYVEDVLGCFALRRCADPLVGDPNHPGCIYGEMKQCLRPCQAAISEGEYLAEVQRVQGFLLTNGESQLRSLARARDEAARALQFETAASLHKAVARVKAVGKGRDDLVCDVKSLAGVAVTKAIGPRAFRLWPMVNGLWQEPQQVSVEGDATMESLTESLKGWLPLLFTESQGTEGDSAEHLGLLVRWYYSSWRDGHWYPFHSDKKLNVRRMGKDLLRMLNDGPSL